MVACLSLVIVFRDSVRFGRRFRRSTNGLIIMKMSRFSNEKGIVGNSRDRAIAMHLFVCPFFLFTIISFDAMGRKVCKERNNDTLGKVDLKV